jgi:hypothetical protein
MHCEDRSFAGMAEFLVEAYVPQSDGAGAERGAKRARAAADQLSSEGESVRDVRSIFMPEDETCFYLFEAVSEGSVRKTAERAALRFERITNPGGFGARVTGDLSVTAGSTLYAVVSGNGLDGTFSGSCCAGGANGGGDGQVSGGGGASDVRTSPDGLDAGQSMSASAPDRFSRGRTHGPGE